MLPVVLVTGSGRPAARLAAVLAQCPRARNALRRLAAMSAGQMIGVRGLTKRYEATLVVDGLSFTVRPGLVTGFLGPNGAGKTTTMRLILGLDPPTGGEATLGGRWYQDLGT
jgi:ABC-type Mn2+/Zn2+ transport system ATPase subunit